MTRPATDLLEKQNTLALQIQNSSGRVTNERACWSKSEGLKQENTTAAMVTMMQTKPKINAGVRKWGCIALTSVSVGNAPPMTRGTLQVT